MTTTKEFKTLHGLSDSAFNRLTNKIKANYPGQDLTRRINSRDWKIIDVALFEQYLTPQKSEIVEATLEPDSAPCTSIQILNSEQCSELDRLAAMAESMEVYKPSQVNLNGSQNEILSTLTIVASKVQGMEQSNLERLAALEERKQKLATAENVLAHFINVGKGLESQAAQINDEAKDVSAKESELKKLLDAMQSTLS